jgi:ligand-binding sensor domain-containing protein/signal transduction histidine kinase
VTQQVLNRISAVEYIKNFKKPVIKSLFLQKISFEIGIFSCVINTKTLRPYCLLFHFFSKKFSCIRLLIFLYWLVASIYGLAQSTSIKFEHLSAAEGLSNNKVQCILQDQQGYIWFGTIKGLNRFDGYTFKVFETIPGDSTTIANNDIVSLFQDSNGLIWVGTSTESFSCYDPHREIFKNYSLPRKKEYIHDFKEDENGLLWLATGNGLFSFDKKNNHLTQHITDDSGKENIQSILKDSNKDIFWLSTETGIRKFNKKNGAVEHYNIPSPVFTDISGEITHNIISDKNGNLWISTSNAGVYEFNLQSEKSVSYPVTTNKDSSSLTGNLTTQIMEDTDGKIWVGGEGLTIVDPADESMSFYKMSTDDPFGIPGRVRAIIKDKSGIYWLGTERGIAKYDPKLYSFTTVRADYPYTLQSANTIIEDRDHKFWIGNYIGLGSMNPNTGVYANENAILGKEKNSLFSSAEDKDGSVWFGSYSCLFHLFKNNNIDNSYTSSKISLPVSKKIMITTLIADENGRIWIGTKKGGLFCYEPSLKIFKSYAGLAGEANVFYSTTISSFCVVSKDTILIGTEGKGLFLMNIQNGKIENIKFNKKTSSNTIDYLIINSIYEDSKKNIWIATDNAGLWQTNISFLKFKNYADTIRDGLQSMNITQIVEDNEGQIWLNTNLGLDVIDPVEKRIVHYSEKDGLSINQPDYLIKKSSGDLIRLDFAGLHIFHSSSVNLNKEPPPVYINHLQIPNKDFPVYNDTIIHLAYNENYVSFDYVALNYTQSFKNRYKYRLEGLDKNWINAGDRRFASYANLNAGTYTFLVTACNNNGRWNEKPASITLIIALPWWRTWWFYLIVALLLCATVYTLFQYRLQQKLKAVELRNRISRDLHDEVGSTLSSIGFLSSMALNDVGTNNAKALRTLSSISDSSHKMLDAMNDIIWSIQPQNDTLNNIIARMISFASEILEARKISLHYNIENDIKHLHLGLAVRHDFYVIFKEAVNNLAKYSEATEAYISLKYLHPYLVLSINDNGKGFDIQCVKNGNGLRNMESRAKKMGAEYQLHSVQGKGTTITLQIRPDK